VKFVVGESGKETRLQKNKEGERERSTETAKSAERKRRTIFRYVNQRRQENSPNLNPHKGKGGGKVTTQNHGLNY